ncbi:MAG: hypothetical protein LBI82_08375 [Dysgonamonadaceae bacterium]|jgi:hypothetical protein|nr:hypothetical protein [Dysgonamonadaceae bacterium]
MIAKEMELSTKTANNLSKGIKQSSSILREEFLRDTISFDEFKKIFAKKLDERIGTSLCK